MRCMLIFLCLLTLPNLSFAQNLSRFMGHNEKPPLDDGKILGEILLGGLGGIGLGYAAARIGSQSVECEGDAGSVCGMFGALLGASMGWMAGSTAGVYVIGNTGDEHGSLTAAFAGSLVGVLVGATISGVLLHHNDESLVIFYTIPPISAAMFATLLFNSSRRYRSSSNSGSGLINTRDGRVSLAVPSICFHPISSDGTVLPQSVNLLKVSFSL